MNEQRTQESVDIEHIGIETPAGDFDALAAGPIDGRPVLLLHGFPEAASAWERQLLALGAAGFRAVAPDQRGYSPGVRPDDVADYRMELLVADTLAMAGALGWGSFDVVGHDWGALVAWTLAAQQPRWLRTLTAVSVPHPAPFETARRTDEDQQQRSAYIDVFLRPRYPERRLLADDAKALRAIYEHKPPRSRVEDYVARLSEPGALTAALNWYRAMHLAPRVGTVSVPTMYVWSTDDVAVGSAAALATEAWVDGPYRFEMLTDVSHWVPEEVATELSDLLLDHLRGTAGAMPNATRPERDPATETQRP